MQGFPGGFGGGDIDFDKKADEDEGKIDDLDKEE
jgi:hypothetical protein